MSYPLLTEKPLLGANFLPPQKSARERAAERWFNREKSPSTTTSTSDKTVAGQYYDEETGLHYNWNRYYDPKLGRYTTSDLIGLAGGMNTYLYANANPVMYVDPEGLSPLQGQGTHSPGPKGQGVTGAFKRPLTFGEKIAEALAKQGLSRALGIPAQLLGKPGIVPGIGLFFNPTELGCSDFDCDKNQTDDRLESLSPMPVDDDFGSDSCTK